MSRLRLVLPALAAAVLAVPAVASCTAAGSAISGSSSVEASAAGAAASPRASAAQTDQITALLKERLGAVTRRDRSAWLAALAPDVGQAARTVQGRVFDRMRAMGVTDLHVVSVALLGHPAPTAPTRARLTATYRLAGFDTSPRTFVVDVALDAQQGSGPTGVSPSARLRSWDPADRLQPWDLDGLRVRRTPDALLLVVGPEARLEELTRRARAAAAQVAAVWGRSEPSVWVAPGTDEDAARLLGRTPASMAGVAAVTDGPLEQGVAAGADRIVIVPSPWVGLTGVGRDVVLAHELTHASVRASTTRTVPTWLAEGFAELVAYRSVALPEREVVAPALDLVRAQGIPSTLPTDADFDPAAGRLAAAYGLSLLAVRELADRQGSAALVRLYREAAGGLAAPTASLGDAEAITDLALARAGTDRATLVRQWRARIAALTAS